MSIGTQKGKQLALWGTLGGSVKGQRLRRTTRSPGRVLPGFAGFAHRVPPLLPVRSRSSRSSIARRSKGRERILLIAWRLCFPRSSVFTGVGLTAIGSDSSAKGKCSAENRRNRPAGRCAREVIRCFRTHQLRSPNTIASLDAALAGVLSGWSRISIFRYSALTCR